MKEILSRPEWQIILAHPAAQFPTWAHPLTSAGADLCAVEPMVIKPFDRVLIDVGLKCALPSYLYGSIRSKSGNFLKAGLFVDGVIDCDYRGHWMVPAMNMSQEDIYIKPGDQVAQVIIQAKLQPEIKAVGELPPTTRGRGGFGSTGGGISDPRT